MNKNHGISNVKTPKKISKIYFPGEIVFRKVYDRISEKIGFNVFLTTKPFDSSQVSTQGIYTFIINVQDNGIGKESTQNSKQEDHRMHIAMG